MKRFEPARDGGGLTAARETKPDREAGGDGDLVCGGRSR
jgi:hypothetical protein